MQGASLETDNDKCNSCGCPLQLRTLLKLPAQKSFESGYFGIKAALLILKPALLILKCSLTLIPVGCQALTITRNLVFTCVLLGEPVSNDLLPLLFHNFSS
jgi:hypothetical protein